MVPVCQIFLFPGFLQLLPHQVKAFRKRAEHIVLISFQGKIQISSGHLGRKMLQLPERPENGMIQKCQTSPCAKRKYSGSRQDAKSGPVSVGKQKLPRIPGDKNLSDNPAFLFHIQDRISHGNGFHHRNRSILP